MFFYIVLTPISTTSGLWGTDNTRKYHQIDVYIYLCGPSVDVICLPRHHTFFRTKFLKGASIAFKVNRRVKHC